MLNKRKGFIIAGGGTGGHLFPALAIGDALKKRFPNAAIHFVGSKFGLESKILPERGDGHTLLTIRGFMRGISPKALFRNFLFPYQVRHRLSDITAFDQKIFHPWWSSALAATPADCPLLAAIHKEIPTVIHEQNSYPGVTTRWLSSRATRVCLSYEDARRHLKKKVVLSPATRFGRTL